MLKFGEVAGSATRRGCWANLWRGWHRFVMCIAGATAGSLGGRRMARAASAAPHRAVPARVWDCGQLLAYTAGGDRLKFSMEGGERTGGSADSEPPPINLSHFIDALSPNYGGFYRVLWRILSREYGWIIPGVSQEVWEFYSQSTAEVQRHYGTSKR